MSAVYPPASPDSAFLRQLCAVQGVAPTDADLEAVRGFLDAILPALAGLEARIPADLAPAT